MIQKIITYQKIVSGIDELMNRSPYKKKYIIEQMGIPAPTFYRKVKSQSFTAGEMLIIAKILNPEEFYIMELKEQLEKANQEYKDGDSFSNEYMLEELKKRKKV